MTKIISILLIFSLYLHSNDTTHKIEIAGDIVQIAIPATALITAYIIGDTQGQYQFYKSFAGTFVTTHILKYTVKETRPDGSNDASFPSGHTSASFQGASFIHFRYGFKYAILPYLGATFVAYSRVVSEKHYTHDVIAGAAIGTLFSWYFCEPYKVDGAEIKPVVFNSEKNNQNLYGISVIF